MRIGNYRFLLAALLLAGMIPSCKSPTAPLSGPTLTLILPDSARAFDTVVFRAHYSDSISPKWNWKFVWQFGDSTQQWTDDSTVSHVFSAAGTYNVQVTLMNSLGHAVAKQPGQLQVRPLVTPTLTLTAPDSVFWGNSALMSINSSRPLASSWSYSWSFGDSTSHSSQQSSVLHYYPAPGIYTVGVTLNDTVHHVLLASQITTVQVITRHFDLALLQSMPYVTLTWNARMTVQGSGNTNCVPFNMIASPKWVGNYFSIDTSFAYSFGSTIIDSGSGKCYLKGNVDSGLSQVVSFATDTTSYSSDIYHGFYLVSGCASIVSYKIEAVPLKSQSDSDVVFEAEGSLIKNASYNYSSSYSNNDLPADTTIGYANWGDSFVKPYVIIRFHK